MDLFKVYGEVVELKILKGKDGKNIGSGFVTFSTEQESSFTLHKLHNTV
jgi:hypothetical protein